MRRTSELPPSFGTTLKLVLCRMLSNWPELHTLLMINVQVQESHPLQIAPPTPASRRLHLLLNHEDNPSNTVLLSLLPSSNSKLYLTPPRPWRCPHLSCFRPNPRPRFAPRRLSLSPFERFTDASYGSTGAPFNSNSLLPALHALRDV